jgi:Tripartite tricarboxylate transporter family receptor
LRAALEEHQGTSAPSNEYGVSFAIHISKGQTVKHVRHRIMHAPPAPPARPLPSPVAAALTAIFALFSGTAASSQTAATTRIIVPYVAGGGTDILARLLAEEIGRAQGQRMLIENRPGAGSAIGTEAVSRATPDGNTVLIVSASFLIIPQLRKLNYHPLTSFEPICALADAPGVIAAAGHGFPPRRRRCTRGRSKHDLWAWGSFRPDNAAPNSPRASTPAI